MEKPLDIYTLGVIIIIVIPLLIFLIIVLNSIRKEEKLKKHIMETYPDLFRNLKEYSYEEMDNRVDILIEEKTRNGSTEQVKILKKLKRSMSETAKEYDKARH